jgi:hypothetical protein
MFAGSSASYDERGESSVGHSFLSQRDDRHRPSKVLGIRIDDTCFPLFQLRAFKLYGLERQLLRDSRLVSGFIWGRRRGLQGKFILGKMSGHSCEGG